MRLRRVTVKVRIVKLGGKTGGVHAHLHYLERDGVTREGAPGRLFSTFAYEDLKPFTRDVMAKMEADLGTTLDWVAAEHFDTGHPHVHVVVRGVTEDGKTLNIAGDYIAHGIRYRASEILIRDLGLQTELEVGCQLEREVEAERLTRLDKTLIERAEENRVELRLDSATTEFGRRYHQLLIARARRLERFGLATPDGPLSWSLSEDAEETLRRMGERGDIIKTMHRAVTEAGFDRPPQYYLVHDRDSPPAIGRVVAKGMADEMGERLSAMAKSQKRARSALLLDMVEAYMNRRAAPEVDERILLRLDRIARAVEQGNRECFVISHSLARFIRHQLIYAAALPIPGTEAQALGEKRYRAFLDTVARMMARGANGDGEMQKESDDDRGASLVQSASGPGRVGPSSP